MTALPELTYDLENASVRTDEDRLTVSTGRMHREWQWTGNGFTTVQLGDADGQFTCTGEPAACDWQLPDGSEPGPAELISLLAADGNDNGFTSDHIAVTAEIRYPEQGYDVRFSVWVYPDAPGIRTQLAVKKAAEAVPYVGNDPEMVRAERIPGAEGASRRYFGYYNDTQRRNEPDTEIIREEVFDDPAEGTETCDWASAACLETAVGGCALVKESHKCVNQTGHVGGVFICSPDNGLASTGWGLTADEVTESYTAGWAAWTIVWSGGDLERQTAFKEFDRLRYPTDLARDIYIQANTWGAGASGPESRLAAVEESVQRELDAAADLGIDTLQIDDGWQVPPGAPVWDPKENGWHPHPESYPEGWKNVREKAAARGLKLGLWAAAQPISLEELQKNHTDGGFGQFKLDFASFTSRQAIDAVIDKVCELITWSGHKIRVNWDVTENAPRFGYFFAREYGSIYLENRKPVNPPSTVYRPYTVLRDLWQVARYLPLQRFQGSVQNVDLVNKETSDACLHGHDYAVVIVLMGIPLFFTELKKYSDAARNAIRPVLATYKQHRETMFRGIVYPVGDKPDNTSWTGFQCHIAAENRGYLTVFRERENSEPEAEMALVSLTGKKMVFMNLMTQTEVDVPVDSTGKARFKMDTAPGFLFLSYTAE